ncbi:hypothetical protein B0J11DRAFT_551069 [Dendryphion nanum]|uniref:25S rRNA (uridine-N(3))-methyltransferase BMT5-like domain-containing protein n=1 Tax=Dendryphion nanum TaxID=256645 RepID=A0A9P9IKD2_9PLEO|nr:hypothetical protein B0J11DRAFT_551069 [Dendryphion nanum]
MSKNKTKRARREAKRDHQKKAVKNASKTKPSPMKQHSKPQSQQQNAPNSNSTSTASRPHIQASQKHDIPFDIYDRILLVGEGDFSFARSLVIEHGCANVTATSFDSEADVEEKYPTFAPIQTELSALTPPVPLHHSIDATKISSYKTLRPEDNEPWDTIAFMFPHTGGLSTDVNRQVRANQALLVSFFKSCLQHPSAANPAVQAKKPKDGKPKREFLKMGGKVIVTLFEGEPYTLWNIRDLARHAGFKVVESWRFDWEQYPGYAHVRTLGAIEGGGAWRGEEREARMYVFEKVELESESEEEGKQQQKQKQKEKRGEKRRRDEESEEDEKDNGSS